MTPRRPRVPIAGSPVLIGAATTLVVLVAVFLAYNANNGLPFVPTYELKANVPSAANVVKGNDVRIGGARVGVVSDIQPKRGRDGSTSAVLTLKLQTSVRPLPVTSTVLVRSRSALGLKYIEITQGRRRQGDGRPTPGFDDGDTIPLRNAVPHPVEIDEVLNTFDERTRAAARTNLTEFGNAFAGRGQDLNRTIQDLNPLLRKLTPVARNLADPATGLGRLITSLERAAGIVAPAAETQAALFGNLDTTFVALARVARPYIQDAISGAPPALDEAVRSFRIQRPFLRNTELLFAELRPGAQALRGSAPTLAGALRVGTPTLRRMVELNDRLIPVFEAVQRFATDPQVPLGIRDLADTVRLLAPTVAALTPTQTVCNYVTLLFRNAASLLSEGDPNGNWQQFAIIKSPLGPNNEGGPSSAPANGPNADNHLHSNPYPNTAAPGQPRECEAGNERFVFGQTAIGNPPGNQGTNTQKTRR